MKLLFRVIDNELGREPTIGELEAELACTGKDHWAYGLCWSDLDGWYIDQYGNLILADECGNYAFPPPGRYRVEWLK